VPQAFAYGTFRFFCFTIFSTTLYSTAKLEKPDFFYGA
jgi:hypothetical protein